MIHRKVIFQGDEYWHHKEDDEDYALLSPLNHYSDDGELEANPFGDISYAIIEGENIMRYGVKIGTIEDLVEIK